MATVFLISACDELVTTHPVSTTSEQRGINELQGAWGDGPAGDPDNSFSIVFDSNV
jgi:hypothetical protein